VHGAVVDPTEETGAADADPVETMDSPAIKNSDDALTARIDLIDVPRERRTAALPNKYLMKPP
jgi:hypothetical protein